MAFSALRTTGNISTAIIDPRPPLQTDAMDADAKGSELDHGHEWPRYIKWFRRLVGGHAERRVVAAVETEQHKSSASAGATSVSKALKHFSSGRQWLQGI
ncbi:hypothetical protein R1flu_008769 [Riccia fluitans]|uniref:Uncharacterized protein n=1 Tax=Riccia fluitans TaxID=41844 RepID=A0ABD1XE70_9MARC